jgi:hypothetical protein
VLEIGASGSPFKLTISILVGRSVRSLDTADAYGKRRRDNAAAGGRDTGSNAVLSAGIQIRDEVVVDQRPVGQQIDSRASTARWIRLRRGEA